jgi:hypothetical protein
MNGGPQYQTAPRADTSSCDPLDDSCISSFFWKKEFLAKRLLSAIKH